MQRNLSIFKAFIFGLTGLVAFTSKATPETPTLLEPASEEQSTSRGTNSGEGNENAVNRAWADRLEYAGMAVSEPEFHVWGSSPVIGPDGKTHLFVARWPVAAAFDPGWRTHSEIAHYVSEKPEGPFTFKDVALKGTGTGSWDNSAPHNPTVQRIGDQYVLLYIANDGKNHRSTQKIGMAIAKSPYGPWKKAGKDGLILSPPDDPSVWCYQSLVGVNNPTLLQHFDGRYFLYFKAKVKGDVHRMGMAIADNLEGPYVIRKDPVTANEQMIEDGYAFVEDGKIHLLTTDSARGTGLLWTSDDGITFQPPILGFDRIETYIPQEQVEAATSYRSKNFERPQLLLQNGRPTHLYMASGVNIRVARRANCGGFGRDNLWG